MLFLIYSFANEKKSSLHVLLYGCESNASAVKFNHQSCAVLFASPWAFPSKIKIAYYVIFSQDMK